MSEKIPKEWKWVKLGEVAEIKTGKTNSQDANNTGDYPLFDRSSVIKRSKKFLFDTEAVIVPGEGKEFIPRYYNGKFDLHQRAYAIFNFKRCISKFIYYNVLLNKDIFKSFATGSTVLSLRLEHFLNFPILLPPLHEQKAIAEVLSSIDDKIDLLHRQNKTLEEMAMTLFRQWFIEPTKDGLPEGWEEVSLGDGDLSKIIPSGIKKFEGFKTYLATGDVESTLIKGGVEITYNNRPSRANMQPEKYSVWFAKKEGIRKLLMFDDYSNIDKYILSTGFTGLKTTELSHYYVWCFILHEDFQDIKDSLVSGSVQPDIPNEAVSQIFIPRPPDEVLSSFNKKVKPLFTKIQFNTSQIQTLDKLRDTLLPKLMSGEVRVKF